MILTKTKKEFKMERIRMEYFDENKACECCNERILSDDPEIAAEMLCDRCNREINEDSQIIGYRKGE